MKWIETILISLLLGMGTASTQSNQERPAKESVIDTATLSASESNFFGEYNEAYYQIEYLNKALPEPLVPLNRTTPQATLESFVLASREGDFNKASHTLNFNLLPDNIMQEKGAILAEKLFYILNKEVGINWKEIPDRPDAQLDYSGPSSQAIAGKPRRYIEIGKLSIEDREAPIGLHRVLVKDSSPLWVFSAQTVENIEPLYNIYGPSFLSRKIPDWGKSKVMGFEIWRVLGLLILLFLSIIIYSLTNKISKTIQQSPKISRWISKLITKIRRSFAMILAVLFFYFMVNRVFSLSGDYAPLLYTVLLTIITGTIVWIIIRMVDFAMDVITERQIGDITDEENEASRKYLTYISIGRKLLTFTIVIVGAGAILSQFDGLQRLGISLMASAGVATLILGIAAQTTLGNMLAGIQIALSNPIRIGDTVQFEDHFGTVENIRFTYLVIKTWDAKRVIVPLQYFITHPFENWSKIDSHTIKPIKIYADPKIDTQKVRDYFLQQIEKNENYDDQTSAKLEITSSSKDAVELRFLCSAKDPSTAWDLACEIREKLIKFVAHLEKGEYLPRSRWQEINA